MGRFGEQVDLNPLKFRPHGIDVTLRPDGPTELYVVNHGGATTALQVGREIWV
jgi:hypothetical protein